MSEAPPGAGRVAAQVVARPAGEAAAPAAPRGPVTAANVAGVRVERARLEELADRLRGLGLTVEAIGVNSVSVAADRRTLEAALGLQTPSAGSGGSPGPFPPPASLADLATGVILPPAPEFHP